MSLALEHLGQHVLFVAVLAESVQVDTPLVDGQRVVRNMTRNLLRFHHAVAIVGDLDLAAGPIFRLPGGQKGKACAVGADAMANQALSVGKVWIELPRQGLARSDAVQRAVASEGIAFSVRQPLNGTFVAPRLRQPGHLVAVQRVTIDIPFALQQDLMGRRRPFETTEAAIARRLLVVGIFVANPIATVLQNLLGVLRFLALLLFRLPVRVLFVLVLALIGVLDRVGGVFLAAFLLVAIRVVAIGRLFLLLVVARFGLLGLLDAVLHDLADTLLELGHHRRPGDTFDLVLLDVVEVEIAAVPPLLVGPVEIRAVSAVEGKGRLRSRGAEETLLGQQILEIQFLLLFLLVLGLALLPAGLALAVLRVVGAESQTDDQQTPQPNYHPGTSFHCLLSPAQPMKAHVRPPGAKRITITRPML